MGFDNDQLFNRNLGTDITAVNTIAHMYHVPDKITVNPYHNLLSLLAIYILWI